MLPRLVLKSWAQAILQPQPLKCCHHRQKPLMLLEIYSLIVWPVVHNFWWSQILLTLWTLSGKKNADICYIMHIIPGDSKPLGSTCMK